MTFVRNFLISFCIAMAIFVPLAYFGVNYVIDGVKGGIGSETTDNGNKQPDGPTTGDESNDSSGMISFVMIAMSDNPDYVYKDPDADDAEQDGDVTDESDEVVPGVDRLPRLEKANPEKIVDFITLVTVNTDKKQAFATAVPGALSVEFRGVTMSLSDALYFASLPEYGASGNYISEVVTGCTGVSVDCYTYVMTSDFVRCADSLGGLTVNLPEATTIYDGATRFFPKGDNNLSSADLRSLLKYDAYSNPLLKYQIVASVCKSVLDKSCTTKGIEGFGQIWARISPYMNYDLGRYNTPESAAAKFFNYRFCKSSTVNVIGRFLTIDGERLFEIDRSSTVSQIKQYGG